MKRFEDQPYEHTPQYRYLSIIIIPVINMVVVLVVRRSDNRKEKERRKEERGNGRKRNQSRLGDCRYFVLLLICCST